MVKDSMRSLLRRSLPVLLAVLMTFAGARAALPGTGPSTRATTAVAVAAEEPAGASEVTADAPVAVPVTGRERILTAQTTASVGASRAPPASAA